MTDSTDDPRPPAALRPPFPGAVRAAGAIWLTHGGLVLLAVAGWLCWMVWLMATRAGMGAACCDGWVFLAPGLVGYALVRIGLAYVTGTARDTLALGLAATLLGAPLFVGAALLGVVNLFNAAATWDLQAGGTTAAQWLGLAAALLVGVSWLASGVLLLRSRSAYLAWRQGDRAAPG